MIIIGYAYYEGRALLYGPSIEISPRVMEVSEPYITIHGTARRIAALYLNGTPVPVTEDGAFEEGYVLVPGYNRILLDAKDKYGKTTERVIEIMYTPESNTSPPANPPESETNQ